MARTWGDLEGTRTELHIDVVISDNGDLAS